MGRYRRWLDSHAPTDEETLVTAYEYLALGLDLPHGYLYDARMRGASSAAISAIATRRDEQFSAPPAPVE